MWGSHCMKTWCQAQALAAKSSGGSELYGVVRGSTGGLGLTTMLEDMGFAAGVKVHADENAAKCVVESKGLRRVRQIEVDHLLLQEHRARRMLPLEKADDSDNVADLMTKNIARALVLTFVAGMHMIFKVRRTGAAAKLHLVQEVDPEGEPCEISFSWHQGDRVTTGSHKPDIWMRKVESLEKIRNRRTPKSKTCNPAGILSTYAKRRTIGSMTSGQTFVVTDRWQHGRAVPERQMAEAWIGTTTFTYAHRGAPRWSRARTTSTSSTTSFH